MCVWEEGGGGGGFQEDKLPGVPLSEEFLCHIFVISIALHFKIYCFLSYKKQIGLNTFYSTDKTMKKRPL